MHIVESRASQVGAPDDVIYGANAIAAETGLPVRSVFHMISTGALTGAFRVGGKLALSRAAYRAGVAAAIAAMRKAA